MAEEELARLQRRLRKKLRQIENLELIDRELNWEEVDKVRRKGEIREELAGLVREEMKRAHEAGVTAGEELAGGKRSKGEVAEGFWAEVVEEDPVITEEVEHFNETEAVAEVHYKEQEVPPDTEGWEVVSAPAREVQEEEEQVEQDQVQVEAEQVQVEAEQVKVEEKVREVSKQVSSKDQPKPGPSKHQSKTIPAKQKPKAPKQEVGVEERVRGGGWEAVVLEGHEDLVTAVCLALELGLVATCSRDTTVKVGTTSISGLPRDKIVLYPDRTINSSCLACSFRNCCAVCAV